MSERDETIEQLVETVRRLAREQLIPAEAEVEETLGSFRKDLNQEQRFILRRHPLEFVQHGTSLRPVGFDRAADTTRLQIGAALAGRL